MTDFSLNKHNKTVLSGGQSQKMQNAGMLYLVATPIGNLGDITNRAIETLKTVDFILAEDTRVTKKLLNAFGIQRPIYRADEEFMEKISATTIDALAAGKNIALVSDAGTPCVSDPGQRLSQNVIDAGFEIYPIPGASSVLAGLVASGIDAKQFAFMGFIPNKTKARKDFFQSLLNYPMTLIMFETGPRLLDSLRDFEEIFGIRKICVARELTKLYEEKTRGTIKEVLEIYNAKGAPKGEIVIILEGAKPQEITIDDDEIIEMIKARINHQSVKEIANEIAKLSGRKSREIYEMTVKLKQNGKN